QGPATHDTGRVPTATALPTPATETESPAPEPPSAAVAELGRLPAARPTPAVADLAVSMHVSQVSERPEGSEPAATQTTVGVPPPGTGPGGGPPRRDLALAGRSDPLLFGRGLLPETRLRAGVDRAERTCPGGTCLRNRDAGRRGATRPRGDLPCARPEPRRR